MKELKIFNKDVIPVYETDKGEKVVYGRELYERLKIKRDYTHWIEDMISYGFNENKDYEEFWQSESDVIFDNAHFKSPQQASALGYSKNHLLQADMAKHIAMLQRTPEGMAVRQKLIDLEKQKPACVEDVLIQSLQEMKDIRLKVEKQENDILHLEQKTEKVEESIQTVADTFVKEGTEEEFRTWVNKSLNRIAQSPNYSYIGDKYQGARKESYERLTNEAHCRLAILVQNATKRAEEKGATKTQLKSINKLSVIMADVRLKKIYHIVIREMLLAYCLDYKE